MKSTSSLFPDTFNGYNKRERCLSLNVITGVPLVVTSFFIASIFTFFLLYYPNPLTLIPNHPSPPHSEIPHPPIKHQQHASTNYVSPPTLKPQNEQKTCNLTKGQWVRAQREPSYYTNYSCTSIPESKNCFMQGRKDSDFLNWKWKPDDCELESFNPKIFLQIVRDKNMAFIGDSVSRNHMDSLVCLLSQRCDGSILLDDTSNFIGEKTAAANNNSARGFNVIDDIKAEVEKACPKVVSCADIRALSARDSVVQLGGPTWDLGLGRRDSTTASRADANNSIPAPTLNLTGLTSNFANQGLSVKNLVALSGGHTIGLARCVQFRAHIYNDSNINATFAKSLQNICPRSGNDSVLAPLDFQTPTHFDNLYFKHLIIKKALLHSDQELFNGSTSTYKLVKKYATDNSAFFKDFAKGMTKMSKIKPLTGSKGQIRINCRKVN